MTEEEYDTAYNNDTDREEDEEEHAQSCRGTMYPKSGEDPVAVVMGGTLLDDIHSLQQ